MSRIEVISSATLPPGERDVEAVCYICDKRPPLGDGRCWECMDAARRNDGDYIE